MYSDVVDVKPVAPRTLKIQFFDGLSGTILLEPSYCTGVFLPLLDNEIFSQARVEHGAVTWPNGLDLAPDTMYQEIKKSQNHHYVVGSSF